jgi:hypothetical protein
MLQEVQVLDSLRERTGVYGIGIRKESVIGQLLPFVIVVGIGVVAVVGLNWDSLPFKDLFSR